MSKRVTFTRIKVIEEKATTIVSAAEDEKAVAIAKHLLNANSIDWRFRRTIDTENEIITVEEIAKEGKQV